MVVVPAPCLTWSSARILKVLNSAPTSFRRATTCRLNPEGEQEGGGEEREAEEWYKNKHT